MLLGRFLIVCITLAAINGCASNILTDLYQPTTNHENLYLRGAFTWWEADEAFKVQSLGNDIYRVKTELIADGQPYEFRFVDKDWSPGSNCGYQDKIRDQIIKVGSPVMANCDSSTENFKFTPNDSGLYDFYIDFSHADSPSVYIEKSTQHIDY